MIHTTIALFEHKQIRKNWHNQEWYFTFVDVVEDLIESVDATDYLKKMRKRDAIPILIPTYTTQPTNATATISIN
jgi:hypothetical protein